jgi:hypothetical protein
MQYVKKIYKKISNKYEKTCLDIISYLDREINYEQSLRYYTDQIKIKKLTMEYEAYKFDKNIYSLSSMPEPAIEEVIRINKHITDQTWGVILESDKIPNINVYIAQMNKVQINARKANFFVVTDSRDVLLKLQDTFNWMNKVFYITPNTYNRNIDEKYRSSINFHCLKHLDKHVSTPNSIYMNMLKDMGGKQVTVPNPNRVFCFNSKRLVPEG